MTAVLAGALAACAVLVAAGPGRGRRLRVALGRDRPSRAAARAAGAARGVDTGSAVPVAVVLDLVAEVVAGGAPLTRAVAAVGESLRGIGDPQAAALLALSARLASGRPVSGEGPSGEGPSGRGPGAVPGGRPGGWPGRLGRDRPAASRGQAAVRLAEVLDLAVATGSSPVPLVRAAAQEERRAAAARGVQAARRLGVLVLLPTGLCLLPAFLLLTVVPTAIGLALA